MRAVFDASVARVARGGEDGIAMAFVAITTSASMMAAMMLGRTVEAA